MGDSSEDVPDNGLPAAPKSRTRPVIQPQTWQLEQTVRGSDKERRGAGRPKKRRFPSASSNATSSKAQIVSSGPSGDTSISVKTFRLLKNFPKESGGPHDSLQTPSSSRSQTFSFVNLVPMLSNGSGGSSVSPTKKSVGSALSKDGAERHQTFVMQVVAGPHADVPVDSVGNPLVSYNGKATQCVFRMAPVTGEKGLSVGKNVSGGTPMFSLSRVSSTDSVPSKVIVIPPNTNSAQSAATSSKSTENRTKSPPNHPFGTSGILGQHKDLTYRILPPSVKPVIMHLSSPSKTNPSDKTSVVSVTTNVPVPARSEVIPLFKAVSKDAAWADVVDAFEATGLSARYSADKEEAVLRHLERIKCAVEDQQMLWHSLPVPTTLEIPGLNASRIGDLLSLGRFIEILQHANKFSRKQKRRFDFDFIIDAVIMRDGIGAYLSLLNWLAWAFNYRDEFDARVKSRSEFSVSVQHLTGDHILACETLRQFLEALRDSRRPPFTEEFLPLLSKLKTVDVSELSTPERVELLVITHATLLEGTDFINVCISRLDQEQTASLLKRAGLDQAIIQKEAAVHVLTEKIQKFEERPKSTRLEDRERTNLYEDMKTMSKEIDRMKDERSVADGETEEASSVLSFLGRSNCLGYDRDFNRYFNFPELGSEIYVESGWARPLLCSTAKSVPTVSPIISNFVFADRQSEVYRVTENGHYTMCNGRTASPKNLPNRWSIYRREDLRPLIDSLNPMGLREGRLRTRLLTASVQVSPLPGRGPPALAQSLLDVLKEFFLKILSDLVDNLFFIHPIEEDWQTRLKEANLGNLKSYIVEINRLISKPLIMSEFLAKEEPWRAALLETNNMSRIYFLCKIMDVSMKWERRLSSESCKSCGRSSRRNRFKRCGACAAVFHDGDCMEFVKNQCYTCRLPSTDDVKESPDQPAQHFYAEEADEKSLEETSEKVKPPVKRKSRSASVDSSPAHGYRLRRKVKKDATATKERESNELETSLLGVHDGGDS